MGHSRMGSLHANKHIPRQLILRLLQAEAKAKIDCIGVTLIRNEAQALLALALLEAYGSESDGFLYFEPCTARSTTRPADALLCSRSTGIVVIECKGYEIHRIDAVRAGSLFVSRAGERDAENPFAQVRDCMFAIRDAVVRTIGNAFNSPLFTYMVSLPQITHAEWKARGFDRTLPGEELLLIDDLDPVALRLKIGARVKEGLKESHKPRPLQVSQLDAIKLVFGDSDVINTPTAGNFEPGGRSLGIRIAEYASSEKLLSREQKALCDLRIGAFPRLIRGVAGSGKTAVLAIQAARFLASRNPDDALFPSGRTAIAAVCFNASLVPLLRDQIERAYRQRTLSHLPLHLHICHLNQLMYRLKSEGWPLDYIWTTGSTARERASAYRAQILQFAVDSPEHYRSLLLDAIFVDEGQDLEPEEFQLLMALLKRHPETGEKALIIFYDDAQNLYAKKRPIWKDIGIDIQGGDRSRVMKESFRNTREVVELGFNVLLGTTAADQSKVRTRAYSNVAELLQSGLVEEIDTRFVIHFAERTFDRPRVNIFLTRAEELSWLALEIRRLLEKEQVRPSDLLILGISKRICDEVEQVLRASAFNGVKGLKLPYRKNEKRDYIFEEGCITVSTIHAAKGYDAPLVFMVGTEDCSTEPKGRAAFYVAATRAKMLLYVSGVSGIPSLLQEAEKLIQRTA